MAFSAQHTIARSPGEVAEALGTEDFHRAVIESLGGSLVSFSREGDPSGAMTVTTVRTAPTDRVPEKARKFVGDNLQIEQVERWEAPATDGSRTGTTTITVPKAKAVAEASTALRAAGAASCNATWSTPARSAPRSRFPFLHMTTIPTPIHRTTRAWRQR